MQFIQTPDSATPTSDLQQRIINELTNNKRVLWLVSGGSNIAIATDVMAAIPSSLAATLTISLVDERYGPVGHPDSNFTQLMQAKFDPKTAILEPILKPELADMQATAAAFNEFLAQALSANDICIGLLGIGSDGHTSGILPNSPAAIESDKLAVCYSGVNSQADVSSKNFQRITTTYTALRMLDASYCCAYGSAKLEALTRLQQTNVSLVEQPTQILKQISESYVYNDQIGEAL